MWIIPKNHFLYSAFAQECVDSKKELIEQLRHYGVTEVIKDGKVSHLSNLPLMWRSTHLSPGTWLHKWNKVSWLQSLFGRMLKHSHGDTFAEKYASSLEDIHASHLVPQENNWEYMTLDTFSHTLNEESTQLDLFAAFSKTLSTTSISDIETSEILWKRLVIRLKKEYSQRKKLALRTYVRDCLSLQWPTPTAQNRVRDEETLQKCLAFRKANANQNSVPLYLAEVVHNWATPNSRDHKGATGFKNQPSLPNQVKEWPWATPSARDWRSGKSNQHGKNSRPLNEQVYGLLDKGSSSTNGSTLVLSPAWVLQLMGTTIQKTFFAWRETRLSNNKLNSPSEP